MGRKLSSMGSGVVVNVKEKVNSQFTGKLLSERKEVKAGQGKYAVYEFALIDTDMSTQKKENKEYVECEVKEGDRVSIFAPTALDRALQQAQLGETIKIVYMGLGEKKRGKNAPHLFDVEVI